MFNTIDKFGERLISVLGMFLMFCIFFGGLCTLKYISDKLNTPDFPWGVVFFFSVAVVPPLIWCVTIILDKKLTRKQKWKKLNGLPY